MVAFRPQPASSDTSSLAAVTGRKVATADLLSGTSSFSRTTASAKLFGGIGQIFDLLPVLRSFNKNENSVSYYWNPTVGTG